MDAKISNINTRVTRITRKGLMHRLYAMSKCVLRVAASMPARSMLCVLTYGS